MLFLSVPSILYTIITIECYRTRATAYIINYNVYIIFIILYCFRLFRSCKANRTAYSTFNLNKVFDVDASSDYSKWPGVMDALDGLKTRRVRVELDVNNRPSSTADALRPISESTNLDFQKFRSLVRYVFIYIKAVRI